MKMYSGARLNVDAKVLTNAITCLSSTNDTPPEMVKACIHACLYHFYTELYSQ